MYYGLVHKGVNYLAIYVQCEMVDYGRAKTTVDFKDGVPQENDMRENRRIDLGVAKMRRGDFADMFSRPYEVATISWAEAGNVSATIYPWHAYFTCPRIAPKISGFSRLKCDMKIKIVVNGSPFRYGLAMASFRPLFTTGTTTTTRNYPFFSGGQISAETVADMPGGDDASVDSTGLDKIMARSQRQKIMIEPQYGKGGEMLLPFVYYMDAIPLGPSFVHLLKEMGTLNIDSLTTLSTTASPDTTSNVTISVFAWAENVEMWGPSYASLQSGETKDSEFEEAGQPKPSAIASTIAGAAGMLKSIPVIGPFALATEMAANAVSGILKIFGWSNPPIITGIRSYLPHYHLINPSPLVSVQDPVLAVDPKNEVTVDPRTVGAPGIDELDLKWLCAKPTIISNFTWSPSNAQQNCLLTVPVTPCHFRAKWIAAPATNGIGCGRVTMPPYTYFAMPFQYWRGTFCMRLKIVCSQFHRGRLAIVWDPAGIAIPTDPFDSNNLVEVLDLAAGNEIVYKVPYMAPTTFLQCSNRPLQCYSSAQCNFTSIGQNSSTTDLGLTVGYERIGNGTIFVVVLNQLQSGDVASTVTGFVETWFEDMEFAVPRLDKGADRTNLWGTCFTNGAVQSGSNETDHEQYSVVDATVPVEGAARIYFGEVIPSIRPLLHRSQLYVAKFDTDSQTGTVIRRYAYTFPRFPIPRGVKSSTFQTADVTLNCVTYGGNGSIVTSMTNTTLIAYVTACFTGWRGSMVWRVGNSTNDLENLIISRGTYPGHTAVSKWAITTGTAEVNGGWGRGFTQEMGSFNNGATASNKLVNGTVSAVLPHYSNLRMFPGNMRCAFAGYNSTQESIWSWLENEVWTLFGFSTKVATNTDIIATVAAGTDFNVFNFVNCPDIYIRPLN